MDMNCYVPGCKAHNHHTYYGRQGKAPEKGVHFQMLDEFIQQILNKHLKVFEKEVVQIKKALRESYKEEFSGMRVEIGTLKKKLNDLTKKFKE